MRSERIIELSMLALLINKDERRTTEVGKPCVCFSYGGHCGIFQIEIYKDGWESGKEADEFLTLFEHSTDDDYEKVKMILMGYLTGLLAWERI